MAGVGLTAPEINNAVNSVAVDATGGRAAIGGREQVPAYPRLGEDPGRLCAT
jgi:hypothetical protein